MLKCVANYKSPAVNIPGWPSQVKSVQVTTRLFSYTHHSSGLNMFSVCVHVRISWFHLSGKSIIMRVRICTVVQKHLGEQTGMFPVFRVLRRRSQH